MGKGGEGKETHGVDLESLVTALSECYIDEFIQEFLRGTLAY
jgi:hypothetical protein